MKKVTLLFFLLSMCLTAQETTVVEVQNPTTNTTTNSYSNFTDYTSWQTTNSLITNIPLTNRWSIENRFSISTYEEILFAELPIYLKYRLNKKLLFYFGYKNDFITNQGFEGYSFFDYRSSVEAGIRYDVTDNLFTEIKLGYNLSKNTTTSPLNIYGNQKTAIQIGSGIKF